MLKITSRDLCFFPDSNFFPDFNFFPDCNLFPDFNFFPESKANQYFHSPNKLIGSQLSNDKISCGENSEPDEYLTIHHNQLNR